MSIAHIKDLSKFYQHKTIKSVNNIAFDIQKGDIVALLGANGAGKSTTIKMLCGLLKPTKGTIKLFNKSYEKDSRGIRAKYGYVPEESAMYEDIGIFDYLYFFADIYKIPRDVAVSRIHTLLKRLDLDAGNRTIAKLSKGMKRKVLIARSLIHDPELLIYDEPASGLDPKTAHFILEFMIELKKQNKSILFSSHHLAHVEQVADKVIIMNKGKIIQNASLSELISKTQVYEITLKNGTILKAQTAKEVASIVEKNKDVLSIDKKQQSLEDIFLSMTNA